jgi:hypothetical protein
VVIKHLHQWPDPPKFRNFPNFEIAKYLSVDVCISGDDSASQHEPQEIINSQTPTVIDEMDTGTQVDDNRYEVERLLGKKND